MNYSGTKVGAMGGRLRGARQCVVVRNATFVLLPPKSVLTLSSLLDLVSAAWCLCGLLARDGIRRGTRESAR